MGGVGGGQIFGERGAVKQDWGGGWGGGLTLIFLPSVATSVLLLARPDLRGRSSSNSDSSSASSSQQPR